MPISLKSELCFGEWHVGPGLHRDLPLDAEFGCVQHDVAKFFLIFSSAAVISANDPKLSFQRCRSPSARRPT
jgi:hypothetical protein